MAANAAHVSNGKNAGSLPPVNAAAPGVTVTEISTYDSPTSETSTGFYVTFSAPVSGITESNFTLTTTGGITGAYIWDYDQYNSNTWRIRVRFDNSSTGGTIRLDVANSTGVIPALADLPYTSGPAVQFIPRAETTTNFISATTTNANSAVAVPGDKVTVTFSASRPTDFYSAQIQNADADIESLGSNTYSISRTMTANDNAGLIQARADGDDEDYFSVAFSKTLDITFVKPVAISSINRVTSQYTGAASIDYTVTFAASVSGVTASNFDLLATGTADGTVASVTGSGTTYTVTVNSVSGYGNLTLRLANKTGITPDISTTLPFSGQAYTVMPPQTITSITRTSDEESTASEVSFLVTFSGDVGGLTASNFLIYNPGTINGTISSVVGNQGERSTTWTVTVGSITGNGTLGLIMTLPTNTNVSATGLPYMDSEMYSFPLPPEILTGGTLAALNTVQGTASSATSFTVSGSSLKGAIVITAPANFEVRQSAGYANLIALLTGGTGVVTEKTVFIRLKTSAPVGTHSGDIVITSSGADTIRLAMPASTVTAAPVAISSINRVTAPNTAATSVEFTVTFAGSISGVTASNFDISTTGTADGTVASVTGSGTTYTVTVNSVSGLGNLTLRLANSTGITPAISTTLPFADQAYTLMPQTSISNFGRYNTGERTGADILELFLSFGTTVTGLTADNFDVVTSDGVTATVGAPRTYNGGWIVPINNVDGNGTLAISFVNDAGLSHIISNTLPYAGPGYTIDNVPPTLTVSEPSATATSTGPLTYTLTYGDAASISSDLDMDYFSLNTTGTANASYQITGTGLTTRTVTFTDITGSGTIGFTIYYGSGRDNASNWTPEVTATAFEVTDPITVNGIGVITNNATNKPLVNYSMVLSDAITGVTADNFDLVTTGTVTGASIGTPVADGNNWTIPVSTGTGEGTIVLRLVNTTGFNKPISNTLPVNGTSILKDLSGPVVTNIVYATTNSDPTKAVAGDKVTMNFTINELLLEAPVFTIAGAGGHNATRPDCVSYTVSRTITESDPAGPVIFAAELKDLYGNITSLSDTSTISIPADETGPAISNVTFTTSNTDAGKALEGDTITLNITSDEAIVPLEGYDALYMIIGNSWVPLVNTGGLNYQAVHVLDAGDPAGFVNARFQLLDAAGNITEFTETSTINYYKLSSDNTLSGLSISPGNVTPPFNTVPITNYQSFNLTGGHTVVSAVPTSDKATVKVNGNGPVTGNDFELNLAHGSNMITIVVTAENGATKTYTINANVMGDPDATLSLLTLENDVPKAKVSGPHFRDYTATVSTSSIKIFPIPAFPGASVRVNGELINPGVYTPDIALNMGTNTIDVVVTSQDETATNTYSIVVTRRPSNNTKLNGLFFDPEITKASAIGTNYRDYTATVENSVNSITVTAKTEDPGATLKINGVPATSEVASDPIALNEGANTINIEVTAPNGTTINVYSIVITRKEPTDATLVGLVFDPSVTKKTATGPNYRDYTASVANSVKSIKVTATTRDPQATLTINNVPVASGAQSAAIPLVAGNNTINTVITAGDGVTKNTYSIVIFRQASNNAELKSLALNRTSTVVKTGSFAYTTSVDPATTTIKVKPIAAEKNATIKVNDATVASGVLSENIPLLMDGPTYINIEVTAQNGTTVRNYVLTVNRNGSNNVRLKSLVLSPAATVTETSASGFKATVSASSVRVKPTPENADATILVNGLPLAGSYSAPIELAEGENPVAIQVTAQDGTSVKNYTLTITRQSMMLFSINTPDEQARTPAPDVVVNAAVSPNGDGVNDVLNIAGIESYTQNTLQIMNSKGVQVISVKGYDNRNNVFNGYNQSGILQPAGTYFYLLQYTAGTETKTKSGYIVLKY